MQVSGSQRFYCTQEHYNYMFPGSTVAFMDNSMQVPCCGVVNTWRYGAVASGDVHLQVWRNAGGTSFEVVGELIETGTVLCIIKLKQFPVPVRLHSDSGKLKFRSYFTMFCDI